MAWEEETSILQISHLFHQSCFPIQLKFSVPSWTVINSMQSFLPSRKTTFFLKVSYEHGFSCCSEPSVLFLCCLPCPFCADLHPRSSAKLSMLSGRYSLSHAPLTKLFLSSPSFYCSIHNLIKSLHILFCCFGLWGFCLEVF